MQEILLIVFVLLCAIPLGLLCKYITSDEKKIYKLRRYIPTIKVLFGIGAIAFYFYDLTYALSLTFVFIMLMVWDF